MEISLIYIYKNKDKNLEKIIEIAKSKKNIEILLFYDDLKDKLNSKKNIPVNIRLCKYPFISKSFIYNKGIQLAKYNKVGIIQNVQSLIVSNQLKLVNSVLQTDSNIFLLSSLDFGQLKKTNSLFFAKNIFLKFILKFNSKNYFINRRIILEEGIFFDEKFDSLGVIDLILRILPLGYIALTIPSKNIKAKLNFKDCYLLGKDLQQLFSKYRKTKYLLISNIFSNKLCSSILKTTIILGVVIPYIQLKLFFQMRSFFVRTNQKWVKICRKLKITKYIFFPTELIIEPTNFCNLHCPLCPTGSNQLKRLKGYMNFFLFQKIIDESKFYVDRILLWNLGEPFLHPDIFSMIQYAKRFNIQVISSTNGFPFYSKYSINQLIDSNIDDLTVSVDGVDAQTHIKYRKGADFIKLINGLKYLRDFKKNKHLNHPIINYQVILMKHTEQLLVKAQTLSKELDTKLVIKYLNLEMVDKNNKEKLLPTNSKYKMNQEKNNTPCVLWDGLVINWDGSVNPCLFDYHGSVKLGNVSKNSLINIWRSSILKKIRQKILADKQKIKICQSCPINEQYSELYF